MRRRKYTESQIAMAKAAKRCGIRLKIVADRLGVRQSFLECGNFAGWEHVEPDSKFIERFNELFQS